MLIKATYRNETRRFSITCNDSSAFPTWEQLYNQLYRIFPISSDIYLSTVIFSPDASKNARIMVGREIHNAEQYNNCLTFLSSSHTWKQPMLRFFVYDNTPHKSPARVDQFSHLASPSVISPAMPSNSVYLCGLNTQSPHLMHCCSASKEDITHLIEGFKEDLSRILDQRFSEQVTRSVVDQSGRVAPICPPMCPSGTPNCEGVGLRCLGCHLPRCSTCPMKPLDSCSGGRLHLFTLLNSPGAVEQPFPGSYRPAYIHSAAALDGSQFEHSVPQVRAVSPAISTSTSPSRNVAIHANVRCDQCGHTPVGTRHKCLDCADYDLCEACISANGAERHNPFHQFVSIEQPGRIVVHRVFDADNQDSPTAIPAEQAPPVVHLASCDLCDSTIQGDRYKCLQCPDYDTCSACFTITKEQHPHSFVKIAKREDIILRSSAHNDMHYATCDVCKKTIYGIRYKCMHPDCPDYDLCSVCEAHPIPLHDPRHPLLKMRYSDAFVPPRPPYAVTAQSNVQTNFTPLSSTTPLTNSTFTLNGLATTHASARDTTPVPACPIMTASLSTLATAKDMSEIDQVEAQRQTDASQSLLPSCDKVTEQLRQESAESAKSIHQERDCLTRDQGTPRIISSPLNIASPPPFLASFSAGIDLISTSSETTQPIDFVESRAASVTCSEADDSINTINVLPSLPAALKQMSFSAKLLKRHTGSPTFPPGAEFVKSWPMVNDGDVAWPNDTKLALVSCEGAETVCTAESHVGSLAPGASTEVTTGELKAPEIPGPLKMSWQLHSDDSGHFGDLISFEIEVAEPDSEGTLSSSIIMPASAATNSTVTRSLTTGRTQSTLSLISLPSDVLSEYADAADVTPISPDASSVEYVMLSGSDSDE